MKKFSLRSFPKINLALDVLSYQAASSYHEIQTVMHELTEPFDEIAMEEADGLSVASDSPELPTDERNTVLLAARLLQKTFRIARGAKIFITKRIPIESGLGGGASNGAAALKGLARLWGIACHCELSQVSEAISHGRGKILWDCFGQAAVRPRNDTHSPGCPLFELARKIGMDCAFFINGGTAHAEHFGEIVTPLHALPPNLHFKIVDTGVRVSTRAAYQALDLSRCGKNIVQTTRLLDALRAGDARAILNNLHSDFEESVFAAHPALLSKKRLLEAKNNRCILLCGSGGALAEIVLLNRTPASPSSPFPA